MNNNEITRIVHDEIIVSLNEALYRIDSHLRLNKATEQESTKATEYYNRLNNEFRRAIFMREYREERINDIRKED